MVWKGLILSEPGGGTVLKAQLRCTGCVCSLKILMHFSWNFLHCWVKLCQESLSHWEMRYFLQSVFFSHDSHRVKGWHLIKQLNSPRERARDLLESWAPGRDTSEELSLHWLGFVASVRGFQILSNSVSFALQCMSQSPVDAKEVTAKKVNSKLGTVPGMELDSLILVPEPKQPGFARASLGLFIELSFGFWSFIYHLLTVHNSSAILLRTWETKTAKQGAFMFFCAVVSGWSWLGKSTSFFLLHLMEFPFLNEHF